MRGSPLWRAAVVLVVLLALGPLLWRITRSDAAPRAVPGAVAVKPAAVAIELTFSHAARKVTLLHLGREIWSKAQPADGEQAKFEVPWPPEGIELRVTVEWPDAAAMAAMRVKLTDPEGNDYERSVWGRGSADEVLVFP